MLFKAVEDTLPGCQLRIAAPIARGYYCKLKMDREMTPSDVLLVKERMKQIVAENIPFHRMQCPTEEAVEMFRQKGMMSKVKLLESVGSLYTHIYKLGDTIDYFYGSLLTYTGKLKVFDLIPYRERLPAARAIDEKPNQLEEMVNQQKMLDIFEEHHSWQDIVGISNVGDFNRSCMDGHATDLINVSEALQEKKIARIADEISSRKGVRIVLIAGPSSSGKTTFSKRLAIQLMACGLKPWPVSLDDYFVDRDKTPLDEQGEYDFESLYALNLDLFNRHMKDLLEGRAVTLPRYNFQTGKSEQSDKVLQLEDNMVLILEGIHGLNPELLPQIPDACKFKIYVSAMTTIMLDDHDLYSHLRQPFVASHRARLQISWLFGIRYHPPLAQCAGRREQVDISVSGTCRHFVQQCLAVRIGRYLATRPFLCWNKCRERTRVFRSLQVA